MSILDQTLLVCPTYNPGDAFKEWLHAYRVQSTLPDAALIIDSSSDDGSLSRVPDYGLFVKSIPKQTFNHGKTRQHAIDSYPEYEYIIFLTQDAILADSDSLIKILSPFEDNKVGGVCGRQLPRKSAKQIEAHARIYNYPEQSYTRSIDDKERYGLKAAFISNSYAAYRVSAVNEVGGFPNDIIFGEDMYVAAKLLMSGYKIAYAADACVYHSHNYSLLQEFSRYFDMGIFHAKETWIMQEFGAAENEGLKYVISEIKYLSRHAFWRIPEGMLRTLFRYTGFRLGLIEKMIPLWLKRVLVMNKSYFK